MSKVGGNSQRQQAIPRPDGLDVSSYLTRNEKPIVLIRAISYVLVHLFGFPLTLFCSYCAV